MFVLVLVGEETFREQVMSVRFPKTPAAADRVFLQHPGPGSALENGFRSGFLLCSVQFQHRVVFPAVSESGKRFIYLSKLPKKDFYFYRKDVT